MMPEPSVPIATLLLIFDILLIVHAAKTGRFMPWGYVIMLLPGIGAAIYIVAELLPEWLGTHKGRIARQTMARAINPGRRYRELTGDLALVDTIANRAALAEECLALGKFDEALLHYSAILTHPLAEEPHFFLGKARAQFGLGQPVAAIATLDELARRWPDFHSADGHLLYAIALEEAGRDDEALAQYANVSRYFPGVEPRVRQAQLLQKLGRATEAKTIAEDVVRGLTRAPAHVRRNQREWLASAQRLARG
jgi:hypothetical protein